MHWIAVPLVAVQKSLVVRVPNVALLDDPMATQLEPLQYAMMDWVELNLISPALPAGFEQAAYAGFKEQTKNKTPVAKKRRAKLAE